MLKGLLCLNPPPSHFSLSVLIDAGYREGFLRITICFPKYELVIGLSLFDTGRARGSAGTEY